MAFPCKGRKPRILTQKLKLAVAKRVPGARPQSSAAAIAWRGEAMPSVTLA
jgi:hypothetical protein